jgi:uncharacterized protein
VTTEEPCVIGVAEARGYYEGSGGGHDFDHVLRVLALAERIARLEGADLKVVCTAALLHDIAESEDRARHHILGAERARAILAGQPAGFVDAVAHAIHAHRFRPDPEPRTLEAQVLSDADKLDAIGAVGIARAFAFAGAHGSALWRSSWRSIAAEEAEDGAAALVAARAATLGEAYTPVHEFVYKLNRIPERLFTPTGRAIAAQRRAFMQAFFDQLHAEAQGRL